MTLRIALFGAGRLGREIAALAVSHDAEVAITFTRSSPASVDALRSAAVDVAIDVSVGDAVLQNATVCLGVGVPLVIGVTGWHEQQPMLASAVTAQKGGVLVAPNFSVGAALFSAAVADAARRFSAALGFDAAIIETHHARKLDAPSGTARALAEIAAASRGTPVPVSSVRVGHVPGVHTLVLDAPYEQVTLTHEARDRRVFADGALRAAHWMRGRVGWFTMTDVVRDIIGDAP